MLCLSGELDLPGGGSLQPVQGEEIKDREEYKVWKEGLEDATSSVQVSM